MRPELSVDYYFSRLDFPPEWNELWPEEMPVYTALQRLAAFLKERIRGRVIEGRVHPAAVIGEEVIIEEGSVVHPGVVVEGPCIIGRGVEIRPGVYIRQNCLIGDNCVVGHATEVKNAILFPGAAAPHFNYVGDSILGRYVNLGAGVKLANLRNDKKGVGVKIGEERIDTGMKKFGAVIGDGVKIGCNAVTNPGCLLGPNCLVYPLSLVSGFHASGTVIR